MRNLNVDALNSFLVFSEKLNFTHAAEELNISQPALFVKIQDLSQLLAVPLYRKVGRRLELTEQGKQVAKFARTLSSQIESFTEELKTGTHEEQVVLAAGEGSFLYLLGPAIRQFQRRSNHSLKLVTANRDGIIDSIHSGKAHLGVASLETTPPGCKSILLKKVSQVVVMPNKHKLAGKRRLTLSDLFDSELVVPPSDRPHRQMLSAALQSAGVRWSVAVEATGWQLMIHFVKLGMGLAVVNSICEIPGGLTSRPIEGLSDVHYHLFHLAGAARKGAIAELKQTLLALSD